MRIILPLLILILTACARNNEEPYCPGCTEAELNKPTAPGGTDMPPPQNPGVDQSDLSNLDPDGIVPAEMLETAKIYFLRNKDRFFNKNYMTLVDMRQHSSKRRLYMIDLASGEVETHNVAHGTNSDEDNDGYAEAFSNINDSHMSSIGFAATAETYYGVAGYSMRLDGLSPTNTLLRFRNVVVHPASYVIDGVKAGRTWGCPAVDPDISEDFIDRIRGGSMYLIWNG